MIVLDIPGTPVPKGRPRFGKGRAFTPAKTRKAEDTFAGRVLARYGGEPLAGALCLALVFETTPPASWPQWRRDAALNLVHHPVGRPDLDNLVKMATDACNGVLWVDDAQLVSIEARKRYGPVPRTVITLHEIEHVTSRVTVTAVGP